MSLNEAAEKHVVTHNGYRFSKKKENKKCVSYWCVFNRSSKSKCTAKMKMDLKNIVVLSESGDHDESCSWKNGKGRALEDITNIPEGKKRSIDFTEEMYARTEEIASKNMNLRPTEIWKMVSDEMDKKCNTWKGMTDCQVKKLVKNTRSRLTGCDVFS